MVVLHENDKIISNKDSYVYIVMKYSRDGETNEIYTSINKVFNHELTADKYCKEMNDRKEWGTTYEVEEEQIISD